MSASWSWHSIKRIAAHQLSAKWLRTLTVAVTALATTWFLLSFMTASHSSATKYKMTADERFEIDRFWAATKAFIPNVKAPDFNHTKVLVVATEQKRHISWIKRELPDWQTAIYVVDNDTAPLHPPKNKGREAMVYLTYIIDNYDNLPDVVLFFHPDQHTWHNNLILNLDAAEMIKRLSTDRVVRQGYMNARCHHDPGCPDWLHLDRPEKDWDLINKPEEKFINVALWHRLHGSDAPVPNSLSQPCCAQFAASRDAIRRNSIDNYVHWRNWLMETKFEDGLSGRVFEYSWQYIFTGKGELCPSVDACYCDGYGVCFGSDGKLTDWMSMRKSAEVIYRRLKAMDDGNDDGGFEAQFAMNKDIMDMEHWLNETKVRAFEKGADLEQRKLKAG